ncbi:MAG: mechanosensitive ion channel protein MscS [Micrococcales bacterium]|nr:mechanosensitive ion channel protein MscS [Micrococcales bacterium]
MVSAFLSATAPLNTAEPEATPTINPEQVQENLDNLSDNIVDPEWWVNDVLPSGIRIALIIVGAIFFRAFVVRWIGRLVNRNVKKQLEAAKGGGDPSSTQIIAAQRAAQRSETLGSLFRNIVTLIVYTVATLMVLGELGFDLAPLIAGAGILGVALGFGAQSLVADFLSGVFIIMEDQYGVGDVVDVGDSTGSNTGISGTVEEVQLRTTKIRSVDGILWFVRNGEVVRVGNKSQNWSRTVLDISVAYDTDLSRAKEILAKTGEDFYRDHEYGHLLLDIPEVWGVEELAADAILIRMVVKTKPGEQWTASRRLREEIKDAFDESGIEIPFPQRTVWVRSDQPTNSVLDNAIARAGRESDETPTLDNFGSDPDGFNDVDEAGADADADADGEEN